MLYVTKSGLYVLQYVIQTILTNGKTADMEMVTDVIVHTETMKMAALILSLIPIVCTYPFLQKYFVKGMMVGSDKGINDVLKSCFILICSALHFWRYLIILYFII